MTGTAVKNAAAVLANITPNAGKSAKGTAVSGNSDFQSVWNNQMGKSAQNAVNTQNFTPGQEKQEQPVANREDVRREEPPKTGGNLKAPKDERQPVKNDKASQKPPEQTDGLSPEDQETAMEALGAAAVGLMQEIADTFGVTMEELQGTLEELGMKPLDLLQSAGLGELVLKLGGAEDSFALLTDEALCGSYKALMERMTGILNETAEELQIDPKQLEALLNEKPEQAVPAEVISNEKAIAEAVPEEDVPEEKFFDVKDLDRAVLDENSGRSKESDLRRDDGKALDPTAEEIRRAEGMRQTEDGAQMEDGSRTENAANKPDGAEDRRNGEKQSGKEADGGQQGNLFVQELRNLQPETGLQQTQGAAQSSSWNADTQDIMRQIMDYMKLQLNADTTNLEMHLHPESLGTLHVQVEAKAGVITASFITQNETVKAALESQIVQLKENFEEQGVKVEAIEVTVQSHAFERNLEQGREQNQGSNEPSKRARVRRINLNDLSDMDDMEEEDVLAADMLAAGGSTVDYTA